MIAYFIRNKKTGLYYSASKNGGWKKTPKLYPEDQLSYAIKTFNRYGLTDEQIEECIKRLSIYYSHTKVEEYRKNYISCNDLELIRSNNGKEDVIWTGSKCDQSAKKLAQTLPLIAPSIPADLANRGIELEIGLLLGEIEAVKKKLNNGELIEIKKIKQKIELKRLKLEAVSNQLNEEYKQLNHKTIKVIERL